MKSTKKKNTKEESPINQWYSVVEEYETFEKDYKAEKLTFFIKMYNAARDANLYLWEGYKVLEKKNDELKKENSELKKQIEDLMKQIADSKYSNFTEANITGADLFK